MNAHLVEKLRAIIAHYDAEPAAIFIACVRSTEREAIEAARTALRAAGVKG